ncbi:MAG: histidine phosphatase family protein [Rhodospirillales bacterium]
MSFVATTRWWWVRHAPAPGAPGRIFGQQDVACDVSDAAAFRGLTGFLPDGGIWIVTPLSRTRQTMAILSAAITESGRAPPAAPAVEPGFAEQHFGAWQGLSWAAMQDHDAAAYATFWADPTGSAPPGGESFADLMLRTAEAIHRLCETFGGRDIIVVAHGGTIRAAVALALGLAPAAAMAIVIDNLSLTRLTLVPGGVLGQGGGAAWRIEAVNQTCGPWIRAHPS